MRRRAALRAMGFGAIVACATAHGRAGAQEAPTTASSHDLRARFGMEVADRLTKSADADDRLRGIQRAAAVHSPEALALLEKAVEQNGAARTDARVAIEVARALSGSVGDAKVRAALLGLLSMQWSRTAARAAPGVRDEPSAESDHMGRLAVARQTAAFALASAFDAKTTELLITSVKGGGVAQAPAAAALVAYPPMQVGAFTNANVGAPAVLRLVAQLGDLRALDAVRAAARASDPQVRGAAIATLGEMGDMRALDFTTAALKEHDARVRAGAAQALVALGVEGAATAVIGLIRDDATAILGMRLAERVPQPADGSAAATDDLVTALAARAASADVAMRAQAIAALARLPSGVAVRALVSLLKDPSLHSDVANAIARSPSGDAMAALEAMAADATYARLAARGYVVRALTRGETSARVEDVIAELAASRDGRDRATGTFALVALGKRAAADTLGDPDARVRRATAMASLAGGGDAGVTTRAALLARLMVEQDEATRSVLAVGLLDGDPDARVPTLTLIDRAEAAAPDSGLAAFALARRSDDAQRAKVDALLGSADPVLRAHTARGIGASSAKDATGRLATAYAYEGEAMVRRAIVFALGSRSASEGDANAPQRMTTLHVAARLDADLVVRTMATRALAGLRVTQTPGAGSARAVAWLHLTTADGQPPPADMTGSVVRADGVAVPIAFDDEGYAIVPGMPPGDAQLVLAPRLPSYESGKP